MKDYKKTLWGSIITFVIGTSCCWISALAAWIGGVAIAGTVVVFMENMQSAFLVLGGMLALASVWLYYRHRNESRKRRK